MRWPFAGAAAAVTLSLRPYASVGAVPVRMSLECLVRGRRLSLVLLACVAAVAGAAGVALAQSDGTTFLFQPGYGPPGTVVTMHGTGCIANGAAYEYASVRFYDQSDSARAHARVDKRYPIRSDGSFDAKLTIPKLAPATYQFVASCYHASTPYSLVQTTFLVQKASASATPSAGAATSAPPAGTRSSAPATTRPRATAPAPRASASGQVAAAPSPRAASRPAARAAGRHGSSRAPLAVLALLALGGVGIAAGWRLRRGAPAS
jgi:hypothetical protein